MSTEHHPLQDDWIFHPQTVSFVGFSGLGKTTLICKLIQQLAPHYNIAYLKHDVHRFEMDREGKDTHAAWQSGASQVFISDNTHYAWLNQGEPSRTLQDSLLLNADCVFVEGHKNFPLPKIIFLDPERNILALLEGESAAKEPACADANILAYVGADRACDDPRLQPYFCRDAIEGIAALILSYFQQNHASLPLHGLILAGGRSRRMGTDKALLSYEGRLQLERCHELLQDCCAAVYLSARVGQFPETLLPKLPRLYDRFVDFGPLGGILTAMQAQKKVAWLVIACDLPFLDRDTLQDLLQGRNPFAMASVLSHTEAFLEPLCCIYEPKIRKRLFAYLANEVYCPQRILKQMRVQHIPVQNAHALTNVNAMEDYERALSSEVFATRDSLPQVSYLEGSQHA